MGGWVVKGQQMMQVVAPWWVRDVDDDRLTIAADTVIGVMVVDHLIETGDYAKLFAAKDGRLRQTFLGRGAAVGAFSPQASARA